VKKNLEISIIREKKTNRSFTNNLFKPTTPAKSSLEILDAMQESPRNPPLHHNHIERQQDKQAYDSNNYLLNYVSFRKQPANHQEEE